MMPMFSDPQTDLIHRAADLVDENGRESFWRTVAARLEGGSLYPTDGAVRSAISFALSSRGISAGSALLRPTNKPNKPKRYRAPLNGALNNHRS
jgi:hypothetical protein